MADKMRWGILSTGNIAHKFAQGLTSLPDAELVAVGSRSQSAADAFGDEFNVPHRHSSYEALASDPDVDVIYIGTPHPFHAANTLLCLDGGKAVLCEKPFTINARETEQIIQRAREKNLFLMEAMWTRYLPAIERVRDLIASDAIGEVRMLTADFGYRQPFNPAARSYDLELGGGALLDVGIYPITLASMLFGTPVEIASQAHIGASGVDEQSALVFKYAQGQLALLWSAVSTTTPQEACIMGTKGMIKIPSQWWRAQQLLLSQQGQPDQVIDVPMEGNGYNYEAAEVARCIRAGLLESPIMSLDESLAIMHTMDTIRAQWGMVYPGD